MGFFQKLFSDDNNINEKSVIGYMSFALMAITMILDLITGYMGKPLIINQYIYESFVVICLGAFGISSVDKYTNRKSDGGNPPPTEQ